MRLQHRLSLAILPAILGPLLILGAISYRQLHDTAQFKTLQSLHTAASQLSASIEGDFAAKTASVRFLAIASPLWTYISAEDEATRYGLYQPNVLALFTDYQVAYPENAELLLYRADGELDVAWSRKERRSLGPADYAAFVAQLRRPGAATHVKVLHASDDGRPLLVVGARLRDALVARRDADDQNALGYLVAAFELARVAASADAVRLGALGGVILTDPEGRPWAASTRATSWDVARGLRGRLASLRAGRIEEVAADGDARFVTIRAPAPELLVVASIAGSDVNHAATQVAVAVGILVLLSLLSMHWLVYRTVSRVLLAPVQSLIAVARDMAGGNLQATAPDGGAGELADLGRALRDLGSGLAESQRQAASRESEREQAVDALTVARDRAEAASRAKSEFLARMSHEIRTPMNGVLGMVELLRTTPLDQRQRRYAEMMHQSADSLLGIINDVLDFSKIEAGRLELDDSPFDLAEVVEDAIGMFAEQAARKDLELVCDLSRAPHVALRGDGLRLRQVLINLLGNAVKFTERGEICLRVEEPSCTPSACQLRFEVRDTGIGIKPESQQSIFDSFSQEDGSTTRRYGGTGLGLAISQQLVGLMGGTMQVASAPSAGSTFHFTVTLAREAGRGQAGDDADLAEARILVVDDNATSREVIAAYLAGWGVHVEVATSGPEALATLRRRSGDSIDAVLLDQRMPGMDGVDVIEALRADPKLGGLKVVMLSVPAAGATQADALPIAVAGAIAKPVHRAHLRACLRAVLAGRLAETVTPSGECGTLQFDSAFRGRSVLLVEDNPVNQELASAMLECLGAEVTSAWNGREALSKLQGRDFDIVLIDCQMPEMDGYEVTRQWRRWEAQHGHTPATPIVAVTANALRGDMQKCLDAGMDGYLAKPFTVDQLRATLDRWLAAGGAESRALAPTAAAAPESPLDPGPLEAIGEFSPHSGARLRHTVIATYLESTAALLDALRVALAAGNCAGIAQTVSVLKSGSVDVGATGVVRICQALESAAVSTDLEAVRRLGRDLIEEYQRVVAALGAECDRSAA